MSKTDIAIHGIFAGIMLSIATGKLVNLESDDIFLAVGLLPVASVCAFVVWYMRKEETPPAWWKYVRSALSVVGWICAILLLLLLSGCVMPVETNVKSWPGMLNASPGLSYLHSNTEKLNHTNKVWLCHSAGAQAALSSQEAVPDKLVLIDPWPRPITIPERFYRSEIIVVGGRRSEIQTSIPFKLFRFSQGFIFDETLGHLFICFSKEVKGVVLDFVKHIIEK